VRAVLRQHSYGADLVGSRRPTLDCSAAALLRSGLAWRSEPTAAAAPGNGLFRGGTSAERTWRSRVGLFCGSTPANQTWRRATAAAAAAAAAAIMAPDLGRSTAALQRSRLDGDTAPDSGLSCGNTPAKQTCWWRPAAAAPRRVALFSDSGLGGITDPARAVLRRHLTGADLVRPSRTVPRQDSRETDLADRVWAVL
jgi:hypothetical protein